ncbi:hypothetical protein FHS01_005775, partial [Longimicrobium terrae]|nr:hypothetical protein [Longimicrobium terrae]MBB6074093.1 hypothetical protein [Longimicrobium terrae]
MNPPLKSLSDKPVEGLRADDSEGRLGGEER